MPSFAAFTLALLVTQSHAKELARGRLYDSKGFPSDLVQKLVDKTFGKVSEALGPLAFRMDLVGTTLAKPDQGIPLEETVRAKSGAADTKNTSITEISENPVAPSKKRAADESFGIPKKTKMFQQMNEFQTSELSPGMRGVFIATRKKRERLGVAEAHMLFERFLKENETTTGSITTAGATAVGRFSFAQPGGAGAFIFIHDESIDPVKLVDRVMEETVNHRRNFVPTVKRMLPIQTTCVASTENLTSAAAELLQAELLGYEGTYFINWKKSFNEDVHGREVKDVVAEKVRAVAPNAIVNLTHARTAVHMQIIGNTGCLSVLPRWREFHEYNLVKLLNVTLRRAAAEVKRT